MAKFLKKDGTSYFQFSRQEIIDAVGEERAKLVLESDEVEDVAFRVSSENKDTEDK